MSTRLRIYRTTINIGISNNLDSIGMSLLLLNLSLLASIVSECEMSHGKVMGAFGAKSLYNSSSSALSKHSAIADRISCPFACIKGFASREVACLPFC